MSRQAENLSGKRFTRLTVLNRVNDKGNPRWAALCDCGNTITAFAHNLRAGKTKSCGCYRTGPSSWKAVEKVINKDGYVFLRIPEHPRANKHTGRVREHIVVMEQKIGRSLLPGEEVHHLNANRSDNRPENLELWNKSHPAGARVEDQIKWAIQILQTYRPDLLSSTTQ